MSRHFGKAVHAGFVVPDVEAVIQRTLASGVGPFNVMRGIRVAARYRGQRHDPLIMAAFVFSGTMEYEFVQQHDATPSAYAEFLDRHPEGGLHHLAYFCTTFDDALGHAEGQGTEFEVVQEFITPDGVPYEIYVQPKGSPDALLSQLMIPSPFGHFFEDMEATAATWSGHDPIRDALELLPSEMRPPTEYVGVLM
jgi:hypothetical protein